MTLDVQRPRALVLDALAQKYDEDQARDERGRFASGGGASASLARAEENVRFTPPPIRSLPAGPFDDLPKFSTATFEEEMRTAAAMPPDLRFIDRALAEGPVFSLWNDVPKHAAAWLPGRGPEIDDQKLRSIEDTIRGREFESAVLVGADGKAIYARNGDNLSVSSSWLEENDAVSVVGATLTHNHPNASAPSPSDIALMLKFGYGKLRAVGELDGKKADFEVVNSEPQRFSNGNEIESALNEAHASARKEVWSEKRIREIRKSVGLKAGGKIEDVDRIAEGKDSEAKKILKRAMHEDSHRIMERTIEQLNRKLGTKLSYKRASA